jgi:Secretion system C-terminal sorting domain
MARDVHPQVASVTMKLERPLTPGAPTSGDLTVPNTKANEWEELSWDFSQTPITDDGEYARITLIFDINNIPAEDVIYYFDDIQLSAGGCGPTSLFGGPEKPRDLTVSPNPVTDILRIDDLGNIARLDVYNMYGQRVATVWSGSATTTTIEVSNLTQGAYILNGYSAKGELKAMTRFVKL